jgi:MarR-like DNA-binding transcriptional regulator SgrR of sgrS sRNA
MRQLNRLNQYQRLWQPSAGAPQQVTVSELASRCFCSERHVRTLLRQAQEAGWLSWRAVRARKRGELTFHVTPESLRNTMMEEALKSGQQHNALELAQLAPKICVRCCIRFGWAVAKRHADAAHPLLPLAGAASAGLFTGSGRAASGRASLLRFDAI